MVKRLRRKVMRLRGHVILRYPARVSGHRLIIGCFLLPCNGNLLSCLLCRTLTACNFGGSLHPGRRTLSACLPWAGMFCAFSAENQRGDRKTQTHRPSYTKQPTFKKICANLRHLRIKNVCYQSLTAYLIIVVLSSCHGQCGWCTCLPALADLLLTLIHVSPFQGSDFGGCLAPGSASLHLGLRMVPALRACFSTSACVAPGHGCQCATAYRPAAASPGVSGVGQPVL